MNYLFWLRWVSIAECKLSLVAVSRGSSPLLCTGLSCHRAQALGCIGFISCSRVLLVVPLHVGSSRISEQTHVPCTGRRDSYPLSHQGSPCLWIFSFFFFFMIAILAGVRWYLTVDLICISLKFTVLTIFSCASWPSLSFQKCLYRSTAHLLIGLFVLVLLSIMKVEVKVTQSCPTPWDPMDYTVHGVLQAILLEWVAFPFSRGSSQPRDGTQVSCITGRFFTSWATREAQENQSR